jgi:hypothetical protein
MSGRRTLRLTLPLVKRSIITQRIGLGTACPLVISDNHVLVTPNCVATAVIAPCGCFEKYSFSVIINLKCVVKSYCTFLLTCVQSVFVNNFGRVGMTEEMMLRNGDKPYAPASATSVQRTWKRVCNWTPPSKDPQTMDKWDYYKTLSMRSDNALQLIREAK